MSEQNTPKSPPSLLSKYMTKPQEFLFSGAHFDLPAANIRKTDFGKDVVDQDPVVKEKKAENPAAESKQTHTVSIDATLRDLADKTGRGKIFKANFSGNIIHELTEPGENLIDASTVAESKELGFKITPQCDSEVITVLTSEGRAAMVAITADKPVNLSEVLSRHVLPKISYYEAKLSAQKTKLQRSRVLRDWTFTIESNLSDAYQGIKFSLSVAIPYVRLHKTLAYAGFGGENTGIWVQKPGNKNQEWTTRSADWMQFFDEESVIGMEMVACTYTRFNTDKYIVKNVNDASQDWVLDCKAEAGRATITSQMQNSLAQDFDNCVVEKLDEIISNYNCLQELEAKHLILSGMESICRAVGLDKPESKEIASVPGEKTALFVKALKENYGFMLKKVMDMTQFKKTINPKFKDVLQQLHTQETLQAAVASEMGSILQYMVLTFKTDPKVVIAKLSFTIQKIQKKISAQRQKMVDISDYNYRICFGAIYEPELRQRLENQQMVQKKQAKWAANNSVFTDVEFSKEPKGDALTTSQTSSLSGHGRAPNLSSS